MKRISQSATMTGMGFLLITFAVSTFLLTTNQSLFSILESVFYKSRTVPNANTLVMATGPPDGPYHRLGKAIANVVRSQSRTQVIVCSTGGSYDNIGLLRKGIASLALAQIDAVDDVMVHDQSVEISKALEDEVKQCGKLANAQQPSTKLRIVTYLYSEMVHLILRPHFHVGSLNDLKQDAAHVWLGVCGGGSRKTAERLLQASGVTEGDIEQLFPDCNPDPQSSMSRIKEWKTAADLLLASKRGYPRLDAFFWTRAIRTIGQRPPSSTSLDKVAESDLTQKENLDPIYRLLDNEAHIAALPPELIDRMATDNLYVETAIPLDAYGGKRIKQGVPTVGLATVLVAPDSYEKEEIRDLINTIQKNKSAIEIETGVELDLLDRKVPEQGHLGDFVHDGAQSHLKAPDLKIAWITAIGSLAGLLLVSIYHSPRWLTANPPAVSYTILLFAILLLLWSGFAWKLTEAEGRFNPNFQTIPTSMRTMLLYIVGSFREHRPVTRQGESLIAWALFVIPLVFGWLTSDVIKEGVRKLSNLLAGAFSRAGAQSTARWFFSIGRALKRKKTSVPNA